jgi:diguanylate cyclase (GGDEF)-like protein
VFLAIDKQTLDDVGVWPWPRSHYALLLDKLSRFGVGDVFIDIDFSTASKPDEDERLRAALSDAGGGTVLPVFKQLQSPDGQAKTVVTQPLPAFAANAWLAFANVAPDDDGKVRRFVLGDTFEGRQVQSVPAVLSQSQLDSGSALIDFSITPVSVPTISLSEVFDPKFDAARLKGRSVVVGAFATELKDIFAVPVYGQLPGPILHILAAETIGQQRLLVEPNQRPLELAFGVIVIAGVLRLRHRHLSAALVVGAALLALVEAAAFVLQRDFGIVFYTAKLWVLVGFGFTLAMTEKVDFSRFLAEVANAEQRNIRRLLRKIVADSTDAVLAFDHHFVVFEASASAGSMLNGEDVDYSGRSIKDFAPDVLCDLVFKLAADHQKQRDSVQSGIQSCSIVVNESVRHLEAIVTISPLERPKEDIDQHTEAFIGSLMIRDMTARHLYEERLQYLSSFDDLTGLMNRRAFSERLKQGGDSRYVAAIGLHRFSVINETMGRNVGDDLLRGVASRLRSDGRIVAASRLGGDVFAVSLLNASFPSPEACARFLIDLFEHPIEGSARKTHLSVRVGLCVSDAVGQIEAAVERAEHALDTTKHTSGSGWRCYEPEAAARQHRSRMLETSMRESLANGEFFLLYQPQVDLKTGALRGAEALLRWQHSQLGLVSPTAFIPVAEASGFISELGRWALLRACQEAACWPDNLSIAVNVAPVQFLQGNVIDDVKQALRVSGLKPSRLTLEVTESAFVDDVLTVVENLNQLREIGCKIALDDFGTGYSSLSYISTFPLDKLKIDQSFVRKMAHDRQSLAIVETIRTLASSLGLRVVAEGIETQNDWKLLADMGCEVGQGYLFGKPMRADNMLGMIQIASLPAAV